MDQYPFQLYLSIYKIKLENFMKKLMILTFIGFLIASCEKGNNQKTTTVQDGIFIHITESYNNPHKVLMPMKMATIMAENKNVLVYLDIQAVELVVKDSKDLTHDGFDSFQTYLKELKSKNVGVYACPTCLKVAGFGKEDLLDGVEVASKDKFFNFTKGRILTLDY